nr:ABC transporter permease [Propionibacteriales bacterium]
MASAATALTGAPAATRREPSLPVRVLRFVGRHVVATAAALTLLYMFLPVFVVVVFSFNDPAGRLNYTWNSFTVSNWANVCGVPGMCDAVWLSIQIALLAT